MPKDNLKVLVTEKDSFIADAKEVLENALKQDFEGVLVVGMKNGNVYRTSSKQQSMTEAIGMIELAKKQMLDSW